MNEDSGITATPIRAWDENPAPDLLRRLAEGGDASVNPALHGEVVACLRHRGDWLAVIIAPAFIRVLLLPGGGELWGDIPLGQRRYVPMGSIDWAFEAASDAVLGDYQFNELVSSVRSVPDMAAARQIANDALATLGVAPVTVAKAVAAVEKTPLEQRMVSRRGFLSLFGGGRR